ncbi:MAG: tetratricopeptide repeat protein [Alphaproteobacteria bacterium]
MRSRDSENSDGFIREVDEAVRQDRWLAVWNQYSAYIVGAALAVIVGTAAGVGWQNYQASQRAANAKALADATALLQEKPAEAADAFEALAGNVGGGMAVVARLRAAEAEKQAGDTEAKLAVLESLAGSGDAGAVYQRLASLLALQESLGAADADAMIGDLDQAATPDNPWRASLIELKAVAQMKAGRTEEARATLETLLADQNTPGNLQRRASELLNALGGPLEEENQTVSQNSADEAVDDAAALKDEPEQ